MADSDLNLSTQPFPAYRLATIALVSVLAVLVVLTIWQASGFVQYSNLARSIRPVERESRVEADALGKRVAELETPLNRPESTAKLNEIGFLNHLILRKNLSWTKLFAVLEEIVPNNVHFTNLTPNIGADGTVTLSLGVRARSIADVTEFVKRVETSPLFANVIVNIEEKVDETKDLAVDTDVDVTLSTVYYPQRAQ
ncbi:MAG TPA: PilN domain-containing protein [Terriglobia bacterium]|nr:PilN domain-containing protein [Terriglobia bacterium]